MAVARAVPGFRPPRQERSRVTVERIVRATQELLAEGGPDTATVEQIVARADSSVGSFYARFEDRSVAIRYAERRFWEDIERRWDEYLDPDRWAERSALEIVARVVRDLVRAMMADRGSLRAFHVQALRDPDAGLAKRVAALDGRIARDVAVLVKAADVRIADGSSEWNAEAGFARVLGAARDAVVFGEGSPESDRRLVLSLVGMYGASLGLEPLPRSWPQLLALCTGR